MRAPRGRAPAAGFGWQMLRTEDSSLPETMGTSPASRPRGDDGGRLEPNGYCRSLSLSLPLSLSLSLSLSLFRAQSPTTAMATGSSACFSQMGRRSVTSAVLGQRGIKTSKKWTSSSCPSRVNVDERSAQLMLTEDGTPAQTGHSMNAPDCATHWECPHLVFLHFVARVLQFLLRNTCHTV